MGRVAHDPRLLGHVGHDPQAVAAGPRGMGPTTPVERGTWATTPKRTTPPAARSPLRVKTVNAAWITSRSRTTKLAATIGWLRQRACTSATYRNP
jgi:hypothetical protein